MKLYLDDDSVDGLPLRLLRQAGHDVDLPRDVGMSGESDPVQLTVAARARRVLFSANHDDFRELHELVHYTGGAHSGILIVRYDNDTRRDLTQKRNRAGHRESRGIRRSHRQRVHNPQRMAVIRQPRPLYS